uniref:Glycos_transf_2 n=1 Tax=uncultured Flavobacteriaceae bacterium TaxID=165436 RepID=A0A060BZQ8_9FLAO|nr:Glycos_transf_2 [uncultured Flavobacteriaceae bacterium]
MKISVILPIYNQELYLDNVFDSLFSQTYDNYEIVAVNDGSTDSSRTILKKYEKDARVTVVDQENAGSLAATATGVSVASGEYVCFVDADDIVGNNYLQNLSMN